jgi:hypothetical protein
MTTHRPYHPLPRAAYDKNIAGYVVKSAVGRGFLALAGLLDTYWRVVEMP